MIVDWKYIILRRGNNAIIGNCKATIIQNAAKRIEPVIVLKRFCLRTFDIVVMIIPRLILGHLQSILHRRHLHVTRIQRTPPTYSTTR